MPSELAVKLTERLNPYIDIPFASEEREALIILPLVEQVIPYLPAPVIPFLNDAVDGLSDKERQHYEMLVRQAVMTGPLGAAPEWSQLFVMRMLCEPIISAVFDYAQGVLGKGETHGV